MAADYSRFKVLLDDAAQEPELGFRSYATALSELIRFSRPEFAVGVFGTWGSGKTTFYPGREHIVKRHRISSERR
jgi:KAP family P-loop domain